MAEIIALAISIDPLAPFKVSDDLVLEFVNVTALVRNDPENAAADSSKVQIIEPHSLIQKPTPRRVYTRQSPCPNDLREERRGSTWARNKI